MGRDLLIGCVGKPSAGKSTFFNAVCVNKEVKTGNYPFTTISPNEGITHYAVECPCVKHNVKCKPIYGYCENGIRHIPIKMLDVAGLVPGAHENRGLGNKFLDDLRQAHVLIHVLDISGNTNAKGEVTSGYDPTEDHEWLKTEIEMWIFNNLWQRWGSITRKHVTTPSDIVQTLQKQLSGYGANERLIRNVVDILGLRDTDEYIMSIEKEDVLKIVKEFVQQRFKFILALNKADSQNGETDNNALRISERYSANNVALCSALSECFLKKLKKQKYIMYEEGSMFLTLAEDDPDNKYELKTCDPKLRERLTHLQDLVLYRFGSTGVKKVIQMAVEAANVIPVYPIKNITTLGDDKGKTAFPDCILIRKGTTVRQFAHILHHEIDRNYLYAEGTDGCRLGENQEITESNNIIRYVTRQL